RLATLKQQEHSIFLPKELISPIRPQNTIENQVIHPPLYEDDDPIQLVIKSDISIHELSQKIIDCINKDHDYVEMHTDLLVRAIKHEKKQGSLMSYREWWGNRHWVQANENRDPKPAKIHEDYIRASRNRIIMNIGLIGATVIAVIF